MTLSSATRTLMLPNHSTTPRNAEVSSIAKPWFSQLALHRGTITVITSHAIAQVTLQAMLIAVGRKAYQELTEAQCGLDPSSEALSDIQSKGIWENIALMLLHIFAWFLYVYTTLRSSSPHVPFVAILFATSFGSSLAQCILTDNLPCTNTALAVMLKVEIARYVVSAVAACCLVFWSIYWNASLLTQVTPVTSLSTCGFLILGIVLMASAPRNATPGPVLWVWVAFAVVCALLCTVTSLARRSMLKPSNHGATDPDIDFLLGRSASSVGSQLLASAYSLPKQSPRSIIRWPTIFPKAPRVSRSSSVIKIHTFPTGSMSDHPRQKRDSGSTYTSSRLSKGVDPFHFIPDTVREPTGGDDLSSIDSSASPSREVQPQNDARNGVDSYLPFDNPRSAVGEDLPNPRDNDETPLRSVIRSDNFPLSRPAPAALNSPADHQSSPSSERYPPSSYTFSDRSRSPISRPPTAASSTPTAPPYSAGSYSFHERRGTLSSDQTYETLPSYHSRRSTPTLAMMAGPSTARNVRSLPTIPPLPSSASLSSVTSSPSFPASPSHLDTLVSSGREGGITVGTPEPSEQ
ncbi:hypothetical protein PM082_009292 [Marasmius tenuissimus]|nr:hypothetical protein PM082_009292 [Marasmius tenuissimus]